MTIARHFSVVQEAALDNIMRLDEMFRQDSSPDKINLVVGVYQNDEGKSPVLNVVKRAEERLVANEASKVYVPMAGERAYLAAVEDLVFGSEHPALLEQRVGSLHTPGGTGALRLAGEFIAEHFPGKAIWIGEPAYPNHRGIFGALGITCRGLRYFDGATGTILEREMYADLAEAASGDIVLLHGCCHNPSGADLPAEGWRRLAEFLAARNLVPFADVAYLGFAAGLTEDAEGVRMIFRHCAEGLVATSFAKNFALYNERAGALSYVAGDSAAAQRCVARTRTYIRRIYSSPAAHGGRIIATVLSDPVLKTAWTLEVEAMRKRILAARRQFQEALAAHQVDLALFPGLARLHGMFALSRLTERQVETLREQHHIYMLPNGRISITGLTSRNFGRVAEAIGHAVRATAAPGARAFAS